MATKSAELYAACNRGVYIPQHFAESMKPSQWRYIKDSDMDILKAGPDHSEYWDAWQDILDNAETIDGRILHQDGDLWVIDADAARDEINTYCQDRLDYEESHGDAGDTYSYMPAESWSDIEEKRLADYVVKASINTRGLDLDHIADLVLYRFRMYSGHIYGPYYLDDSSFIIAAYPIQEVEIDLSSLSLDGITFDFVRESCDPYIKGDLAYLTTDAVWYAGITKQALQAAIDHEVE